MPRWKEKRLGLVAPLSSRFRLIWLPRWCIAQQPSAVPLCAKKGSNGTPWVSAFDLSSVQDMSQQHATSPKQLAQAAADTWLQLAHVARASPRRPRMLRPGSVHMCMALGHGVAAVLLQRGAQRGLSLTLPTECSDNGLCGVFISRVLTVLPFCPDGRGGEGTYRLVQPWPRQRNKRNHGGRWFAAGHQRTTMHNMALGQPRADFRSAQPCPEVPASARSHAWFRLDRRRAAL